MGNTLSVDKQIEEMEIALREAQYELDKAWHECLHNKGAQPRREFLFTAQYLVENKGYRKASEVAREIVSIIKQRIATNKERKEGMQSTIWQAHYEGCIQAYTDIKEIIEQKYTEGAG